MSYLLVYNKYGLLSCFEEAEMSYLLVYNKYGLLSCFEEAVMSYLFVYDKYRTTANKRASHFLAQCAFI